MLWKYVICSIGRKFIMGIQVNITLPAFLFLTCFLAVPQSLKVFTFMMVVSTISLGLNEQHHQRHSSTMEGLANELLKRVMCCIIEGIKGRWYPLRNGHQARNTYTQKNKRNENSKQHKLHRNWNWNWKTNQSLANLIRKAFRRNNCLSLQPSWGSTSINSNKIYEKNKKILDNEDSGRSGSSSGQQHAKNTGKETTQTTRKESYPEQQLILALTLFPLPHQMRAPYFDGTDVTDFVI